MITSLQNNLVKSACSLTKRKYRDETGCFIVEGIRLVEEAAQSDWEVETCFILNEIMDNTRVQRIIGILVQKQCRVLQITQEILKKISETEHPQGIVAIVRKKIFTVNTLVREKQPLIILLDAIQDPGNVGSIIRAADAAGATGVVVLPGCADLFCGKTVRASMGSLFHLPVIGVENAMDLLNIFRQNNIKLYATALENATDYYQADFRMPVALVFGNEGNGVKQEIVNQSDGIVKIPINGRAESLNVAQAAAVFLFEAIRQRHLACF